MSEETNNTPTTEAQQLPRNMIYTCTECGRQIVTRFTSHGTAAMYVKCRATVGCEGSMIAGPELGASDDTPATHEWFRPEISADMPKEIVAHFQRGGMAIQPIAGFMPIVELRFRLAAALSSGGDPMLARIIERAQRGVYDEISSSFEKPIELLEKDLRAVHRHDLADRAKAGEWNATPEDHAAAQRAKFFATQAQRGEAQKAATVVKEMRAARAERRRIHGAARRAERLAKLERRRGAK